MTFPKLPICAACLLCVLATFLIGADNQTPVTVEAGKIRLDTSLSKLPSDHTDVTKKLFASKPARVILIVEKGNPECDQEMARLRKPGGDFEKMASVGWKIGEGQTNHIQIIDRTEVPELVRRLNTKTYPCVACIENGEIVRSFKDGCTTPLDPWTFGWLIKGQSERPASAISEPARVETTGNYRLRGNHWTLEGDPNPSKQAVINHLKGPNHGHASGAYGAIENWSYQELLSLHDDLHEREGGTVGGYAPQGYYQAPAANRSLDAFAGNRKALGK